MSAFGPPPPPPSPSPPLTLSFLSAVRSSVAAEASLFPAPHFCRASAFLSSRTPVQFVGWLC